MSDISKLIESKGWRDETGHIPGVSGYSRHQDLLKALDCIADILERIAAALEAQREKGKQQAGPSALDATADRREP